MDENGDQMLKAKQQSENSEMGICREGSSAL